MITIITSLYKSERYLKQFLKNVDLFLKNKNNNLKIEFIVIANNPSEKELLLLNNFNSKNHLLKIITVERESLYASWNRGISLAQGEIIGFWNVDDIRFPEAIEDGVNLIKNGADLVYFPFIYKRYINIFNISVLVKRKKILPSKFSRDIFIKEMHCGPFFIFKKDFYKKVGLFDEQFKIVGDFDWCVRAAKIGCFKLSNNVAGVFKNQGISLSGSKNPRHIIENNIVYIRNNIKDKVISLDNGLLSEYQIDKIFS